MVVVWGACGRARGRMRYKDRLHVACLQSSAIIVVITIVTIVPTIDKERKITIVTKEWKIIKEWIIVEAVAEFIV